LQEIAINFLAKYFV